MQTTITMRSSLDPKMRAYAEEKLHKLKKYRQLHEVRMILEIDGNKVPTAFAEVIAHVRHTQLVAKEHAETVQEAVDLVVDKIDQQIAKHKDKVTDHKGHMAAHGQSPLDDE